MQTKAQRRSKCSCSGLTVSFGHIGQSELCLCYKHFDIRTKSCWLPITGLTREFLPGSTQNQLAPPQESLPLQLSNKQAAQQDASQSQLPGPSSTKQVTPLEPLADRQQQQQQPPEATPVQKAAVHGRPERPTSARRGPPKIAQTGSAGKCDLSPLQHEADTTPPHCRPAACYQAHVGPICSCQAAAF